MNQELTTANNTGQLGGNTRNMGPRSLSQDPSVNMSNVTNSPELQEREQTIMQSFAQAQEQQRKAAEASRGLIDSQGAGAMEETLEQGERQLHQTREFQRGFAQSPVMLSLMASETEKRIRGLQRDQKELLMMNEHQKAQRISDLILQEQDAITQARTQFLNEFFTFREDERADQRLGFEEERLGMDERRLGFEEQRLGFEEERVGLEGERLDFQRDQAVEDARRFDMGYQLSREQFEENQRQFGLNYALKQEQQAMEVAEQAQNVSQEEQARRSEALGNLSLVDEILESGRLGSITGRLRGITGRGMGAAQVREQLKTLDATLALSNIDVLEGKGAINEFQARTLRDASHSMAIDSDTGRVGMREEHLVDELAKVRGVFRNAAGLDTTVELRDPNTGEVAVVSAYGPEIERAIMDGLRVKYLPDIGHEQGLPDQERGLPQSNFQPQGGQTLVDEPRFGVDDITRSLGF